MAIRPTLECLAISSNRTHRRRRYQRHTGQVSNFWTTWTCVPSPDP